MSSLPDLPSDNKPPLAVAIPASAPRAGSAWLAWLGRQGLKLLGWQISGHFVDSPKLVAVVAPHSSNWDWIIGVFGLWALRLRFNYLIKQQAMVWPLSVLIRSTGGIAIDRSNPYGVVDQLVDEFNRADQLWYAITPEGTRKAVTQWKNGFLRVAYAAGVPVVPVSIDYPSRRIAIGEAFVLSGNIDQDLQQIQQYFRSYSGRR